MKTLARHRDKAEIVRRLKDVGIESVPRWGRMSAHQMVCHLSDSLRMVCGQKPVCRSAGPLQGALLKWIALYAPLPWPAGIRTSPELDQESGGTRPVDFDADVAELEALLSLVTASKGLFGGRVHPIFGRMSEAGWFRWAYLHTDHHLRQFGA